MFAGAALAACGSSPKAQVEPSSTTIPKVEIPAVGLFGDSLAWEAEPYFRRIVGASGERTLSYLAVGGVAPCDLLPNMLAAARGGDLAVAVLAFAGNALTPCMRGVTAGTDAHVARYRQDVLTAVSAFKAAGIPVVLAAPPISRQSYEQRNRAAEAIGALYVQLAADDPTWVHFVDAGAAVEGKGGAYTWTLPCLMGEPCTGRVVGEVRTNVVRSPDGVHFCPVLVGDRAGRVARCPVYASGAFRYALALAQGAMGPTQRSLS